MNNHVAKYLLAGIGAMVSAQALGWGQKGHDTVAFIAENHLTATTKAALDTLLEGKSIVYWSNWLDNASHTPEYAYTKTWHYKNIDADRTFRSAPLHPGGDVVRAVTEQVSVMQDTARSREEKALALKIVVHLVGDMHQPMHLGHASDLGGNRVDVKFFRTPTNLHSAWDSRVLESGHKWSYTEWQREIDRATPGQIAEILTDACPEHWAEESYELAGEIYAGTPAGTDISYDYVARWTPVIEGQLLRGGLRLADILNTVYDPGYNGAWAPRQR